MTVGEIIRRKRLEARMSCRQLAKESGLSLSTIFRTENDVTHHHMSTLKLIALALGISVEDIVNNADNM